MSRPLTDAMIDVLILMRAGWKLAHNPHNRRTYLERGMCARDASPSTVRALRKRGLIETDRIDVRDRVYKLTEAGRDAVGAER